jgi:hypothetical protein
MKCMRCLLTRLIFRQRICLPLFCVVVNSSLLCFINNFQISKQFIPVTDNGGLWVSETSSISHCVDNRLADGVKVWALCASPCRTIIDLQQTIRRHIAENITLNYHSRETLQSCESVLIIFRFQTEYKRSSCFCVLQQIKCMITCSVAVEGPFFGCQRQRRFNECDGVICLLKTLVFFFFRKGQAMKGLMTAERLESLPESEDKRSGGGGGIVFSHIPTPIFVTLVVKPLLSQSGCETRNEGTAATSYC